MRVDRLSHGGPFQAIAHRGDPVNHRENTLAAVASAVAAGADVVEIDIKTTADEEVVLLHDDTLERLWGDPRLITEVRADELAAIGDDDHQIPRLADALGVIGRSDSALLVDLDHPRWAAPGLAVVGAAVASGAIASEQILWCGRPDSLAIIRETDPQARIIFSWDESNGDGGLPPESMITDLAAEAFNPHWSMINDAVVDWAAGLGLAVSCWTIDDPAVMKDLLGRGVDAMITNRIHQLQELRHGR